MPPTPPTTPPRHRQPRGQPRPRVAVPGPAMAGQPAPRARLRAAITGRSPAPRRPSAGAPRAAPRAASAASAASAAAGEGEEMRDRREGAGGALLRPPAFSSMPGSPGRLIDLDQEYSGGASARTAAGGTPQVPLAPRLASPHAPQGLRGPPGTPAPLPPPPLRGSGGGSRFGSPLPLSGRSSAGWPPAGEPSPLTPKYFWKCVCVCVCMGVHGNSSLFPPKPLLIPPPHLLGSIREPFQLSSLKSFLDGINFFSFYLFFFPPPLAFQR